MGGWDAQETRAVGGRLVGEMQGLAGEVERVGAGLVGAEEREGAAERRAAAEAERADREQGVLEAVEGWIGRLEAGWGAVEDRLSIILSKVSFFLLEETGVNVEQLDFILKFF